MWHAGKAAVQSAAQPVRAAAAGSSQQVTSAPQQPEGKQQGFRWPWQQEGAPDQEDVVDQVDFTALLCSLHATRALHCMFGNCHAELVGTLQFSGAACCTGS